MVTSCVERMPMARVAPRDRSKLTPLVKGPRSFTRTTTVRLVRGLPTTRQVPKGKDRCAAVLPLGLNLSPDAVRCPASSWPYQVARTTCSANAGVVKNIRPSISQFRVIGLSGFTCRTLCFAFGSFDWCRSSDHFDSEPGLFELYFDLYALQILDDGLDVACAEHKDGHVGVARDNPFGKRLGEILYGVSAGQGPEWGCFADAG